MVAAFLVPIIFSPYIHGGFFFYPGISETSVIFPKPTYSAFSSLTAFSPLLSFRVESVELMFHFISCFRTYFVALLFLLLFCTGFRGGLVN